MDCRDRAVGQAMPISINLWVPTRGQSWDSCDHYKVVSSLEGLRQGLWGERMKSARFGTVFRDGCCLSSLLGGNARAPSQSFICRTLLGINCHLLVAFCFLCPQSCGPRGVFLEQVERMCLEVVNGLKKIQLQTPKATIRKVEGANGCRRSPTGRISHPDLSHPWPGNMDGIFPATQQLPPWLSASCGESMWELATPSKKARCVSFLYASLTFRLLVNATLRLKAVLRLVAEWRSGLTIRMVT